MKSRVGGRRPGAGRKPEQPGEPRRNRLVLLLTDRELERVTKLAERAGLPLGTFGYRMLARALRRARS